MTFVTKNRRVLTKLVVSATAVIALMSASSATAGAQRFEGVITMRLSGGLQGLAGGTGRGGPGRGGDARGGGRVGVARADSTSAAAGNPRLDGRGGRGGFAGGGGRGRTHDSSGRADAGADSRAGDAVQNGRGNTPLASRNGTAEIEYLTRRGRVRVSFGTTAISPGAIIFDPAEGVIYTLVPAAAMYMETSIAQMAAADTMPMPATRRAALAAAPVVTHTKKFELIAEHRCEHVLVTIAKQQTDICIAKGLGTFIMPTGMGRMEAWQKALNDANGFPLKVVQPDGTVLMEVTKVERKSLPETLFTVPDNYTKMPDRGMRPPE